MNNNGDIIIYGAGRAGKCAVSYYDKDSIICFVDLDESKWGKEINGIEILSPRILKDYNAKVVVTVQSGTEAIIEDICNKYSVEKICAFKVQEKPVTFEAGRSFDPGRTVTVHFAGGLGNQMFQYALYRAMQKAGKKVYAIRDNKIDTPEIILDRVFTNAHIEYLSGADEDLILEEIRKAEQSEGLYAFYREKMSHGTIKEADRFLLDLDGGIIRGLHQTRYFADVACNELSDAFRFDDHKVRANLKECWPLPADRVSVSIHLRRGDYLSEKNVKYYGGICTPEYYHKAMDYIREKVENPLFCFFSNDPDWARKEFDIEDAVYVSPQLFDQYEDWYDMYLMSQCEHNIIANSTFSWWGAWLNRNPQKIVLAPARWINCFEYKDIYPEEWIRIRSDGCVEE